ncbi:hypothetical protein FRC02_003384 [Tulasnella sp. 418]|nr:hypothetical protein FRC02_003384 [Tulasnella sp. 418]
MISRSLDKFLDVARGLDALHPTLVHGDIKAQNVLVTKEGKAVLCDFGSSRVQDALAVPSGLTTANDSTATTVLFRSPELLGTNNPVPTLASDIWAMGCLAIQIIVNRPPWAHYGIESHIFAPEAIKGDMPLERVWHPGTMDEIKWWKYIKHRCWKLDPEERCTAKKLLEDGIRMVTRQMDPFLMGHILTKACTVAGRKISEFVLEREYGLPKDALCAEVIEAAVKQNKSFANWKMFTLSIQTKDEEPQRLRLWTDCPFEIYEKWDPKERPRFLFKIIKEHSPFEPEPSCGIEEGDYYSTVLTRVLDAHGVDGDRSEYILIIKCGDNGEQKSTGSRRTVILGTNSRNLKKRDVLLGSPSSEKVPGRQILLHGT